MDELEKALAKFREVFARFAPTSAHLVPDLVLLGYVSEVLENLEAARVVLGSAIPHRAHPSVRAASEAAQLALLLTAGHDYDLEGATAWLYYQNKDAQLVRTSSSAPKPGDAGYVDPDQWYADCVQEMADVWETYFTGARDIVLGAVKRVANLPRKPDNWMGKSVATELQARLEQRAKEAGTPFRSGSAGLFRSAYSASSRETHPRTRFKPDRITRRADGSFHFELPARPTAADRQALALAAAGAVNQLSAAIGFRLQLA